MNHSKDFKTALLEQEGLRVGTLPDERRKEIEMILKAEQKRLHRMRWVTVSLWVLWAGLYVTLGAIGLEPRRIESDWATVLFLIWVVLLPAAVVSSISLYIRWRAAGHREIRVRLELLEEKLSRLEGGR